MLPRRLRLKRPQDFQVARRRGQRWRGRSGGQSGETLLTLHTLPNGLPHSRFGLVVSKQLGTAVTRNSVKRRLRVAIRQWLPELASGFDAVLVAHGPAATATYEELAQATENAFRQAQLIAVPGEDVGR